jgi:hypothetical protein
MDVNSIGPPGDGGWRLRPQESIRKNRGGAERAQTSKEFPPRYASQKRRAIFFHCAILDFEVH